MRKYENAKDSCFAFPPFVNSSIRPFPYFHIPTLHFVRPVTAGKARRSETTLCAFLASSVANQSCFSTKNAENRKD